MTLPKSDYPLLIRTDFSDENRWAGIVEKLIFTSDGLEPDWIINSKEYEGLEIGDLPKFSIDQNEHDFIFLADSFSMTSDDAAICCVDLSDDFGTAFRVLPSDVFEALNILFSGKVDFADLMQRTDENKLYRSIF